MSFLHEFSGLQSVHLFWGEAEEGFMSSAKTTDRQLPDTTLADFSANFDPRFGWTRTLDSTPDCCCVIYGDEASIL